ncbi:MAG TPA: outer membrane beta-barrel protein [Usitatibacter sp.]|nr:outer membrane beta-barrel protein [Usitatibacter sp.]
MTSKKLTQFAVSCAMLAMAGTSYAQYIRPSYQFPAAATGGVELGDSGAFATPSVGLGLGHDDNLFLSSTNQKDSVIEILAPGFRVDAHRPGLVLKSDWQGQFGRYTSSRADDYQDYNWANSVDWALDQRTFFRLGWDYIRGHDARGSTDRPTSDSPDFYKVSVPRAMFAYGAPGAQGRVELYYSDAHKDYLNHHEVTAISDRDTTETGGAFYWRVGPKTYALVEARDTKIDYDIQNPLSGHEHRYFLGVSWEATAATTGTVKVGELERTFAGDIPSHRSPSWEAEITWSPRTYSQFDFYSSRYTNESTGLGDYILTSLSGVNWTHQWNSRVSSAVILRYQRDEYQGFDRTDNTKIFGLKVGYKMRPWLTLGAEYTYTNRDSNIDIYDYDKNLYLLTATASM